MPQFKFNTISRADIERSRGGNIMIQAIDYDGNDNQLITGVPGSGKTTVTIMRAERLSNLNKRIIIFTFQKLLTLSLNNIASNKLEKKIKSFYKWYSHVSGGRWVSNDDTEMMKSNLNSLSEFDEILIDEGQDFEEKVFKTLLTKSRQMTVGADNAQKVHERGIHSDRIELLLEASRTTLPIKLEYNYRNTYEIYNFARYFMPDNERANKKFSLDTMIKGEGNKPIIIQVISEDEKTERLNIILEDAGDKNIAVLLFHQHEVDKFYDMIRNLGFSCTKYTNKDNIVDEIENILITTYKSAKGLEFQVVIMPEMHTAMDNQNKTREHYYTGCTRAKESLFLMFSGYKFPDFLDEFDEETYDYQPAEINSEKSVFSNEEDDLPF